MSVGREHVGDLHVRWGLGLEGDAAGDVQVERIVMKMVRTWAGGLPASTRARRTSKAAKRRGKLGAPRGRREAGAGVAGARMQRSQSLRSGRLRRERDESLQLAEVTEDLIRDGAALGVGVLLL